MKGKKRRRWRIFLWLAVLAAGFWWFENFTVKITQVALTSEKVTQPIRLVQLSDLHDQDFGLQNQGLIKKIARQEPDLIAVTGDMVTSSHLEREGDWVAGFLGKLCQIAPVYYVPGEHDKKQVFYEKLEAAGVRVLDFEKEELSLGGSTLIVYGNGTVVFQGGYDLCSVFSPVEEDHFGLLLTHLPSFDRYKSLGADLILAGDGHGGIVRLPFVGPLYYEGSWLPRLTHYDKVYDKGLYEEDGQALFVSSGLGNYPLPLRVFNRPEIAVITIQPAG